MFVCKNFIVRTNVWRRLLVNNAVSNYLVLPQIHYSGLSVSLHKKYFYNHDQRSVIFNLLQLHRKWCSKGLIDGDVSSLKVKHGTVQKEITELFPLPRVTLNELTAKTPNKIFDIQYKQNTVAPKGRKKGTQDNSWTCTYAFVWPEKGKFEGTAISKRQAAEKAAVQAIHWLYINKKINSKGQPIYNQDVIKDMNQSLNEPVHATISENSMERVERIWNDYEKEIKDIYEATFKEAKHKIIQSPAVLTKDSSIDEDEFSEAEEDLSTINDNMELKYHVHPVYGRNIKKPSQSTIAKRDRYLQDMFERYDEDLSPLPIDNYTSQIISSITENRVSVMVGAAGCGKSTRAPTAILRHCGANTAIIVSQPRRMAAIGLAERVASELGEEVGESVGYHVRLHSKPPQPPCGSILYCTSGVLLRRLQTNPGLQGCTHVIIDEAHERDVNTDVTLLLLKRALIHNPDLKIVIMSATLDTGVFTKYFEDSPVIEVPGTAFPVDISYLEDMKEKFGLNLSKTLESCQKEDGKPQINCQEIAEVIKAVDKHEKEGAILVFLPGWSEIKLTKQLLEEHYGESALHLILPVHSRLSTTDQAKMFGTPSLGVRKIVLSTNIAETSITIPDVVYVIDSGTHKENRIRDGTGTASLETVWVSQAGAKQRTGRAGRVQPGHCYRMYTKEKESEFAPHTTPEILRIPLEQTVLDCKSYAPTENISSFLSQLPEPPSDKAIQFAVNDLIELGALTPQENLTRLGSLLSTLTLHPRIGRSLLHSAVIGNMVAVGNMAAHCSTNCQLFYNAADRRDEIREIKRNYSPTSDHAAFYWIQDEFERLLYEGRSHSDKYCERHGLRGDQLVHIRSITNLHLEQVLKSGFIEPTAEAEELNRFSGIEELLCGALMSGADAVLTTKRRVKIKGKLSTKIQLITSTNEHAHIATESVNKGITKVNKNSILCYFGGHHSTERRALVVYKTSLVPPQAPLLFCFGDIKKEENGETTILTLPKHRLSIHVPTRQADHILKAREMLWNTFDYYIQRDVKSLDFDDNVKVGRFKVRLIKAVGRILVEAHREYVEGKTGIENVDEIR